MRHPRAMGTASAASTPSYDAEPAVSEPRRARSRPASAGSSPPDADAQGTKVRHGHGVTADIGREWARRTRAEQGLPLHVTDPGVLHRVLTLMGRTPATRPARNSERDPAA
jgi:hypothetical protein